MKKNKNILNVFVGVISQAIILCMGFIVPRIIMTNYGSDTNGLTNTVVQVFTYLALLQAGISQAAKNALYKPIQEKDKKQICLILSSAKLYFKRITVIYAIVVIILSFFLPFILKSNVPYWTIFFIVFFEGFTEVVSFYFINTKTTFLTAIGKDYIKNIIELIGKILCYIVKICLALKGLNIAIIQCGYFFISLIKMVAYYIYMKKRYSWIDLQTPTNGYKLPDRNSFIITEIAWTVFSSTDMIVLSTFVSTALSSVYSVYNLVFVSINNLLSSIFYSITYNLGIAYNEDKKKYVKMHDIFQSLFVGGMTSLMCISYILILPFVTLYTKSINDIQYVFKSLPIMFCLVQIFSWSRYVQGTLIGIAGFAKRVTKISILEAALNAILSIVLVNRMGIIGVLLATVSVLPIKIVYSTYLADHMILKRGYHNTLKILTTNYLFFFCTVYISKYINLSINNAIDFIKWGVILSLIFVLVGALINYIANPNLKDIRKIF